MKLKLKITSLSFEGEIDLLPTLAAGDGQLIEAAPAETIPLPSAVPPLLAAAVAVDAEYTAGVTADPAAEPAEKPKRTIKRRTPRASRPGPDQPPGQSDEEPAKETGAIRIDTGRRSSRETLDAIRLHGPLNSKDLGERLGITPAAAAQRLYSLMAKGEVQCVSRGVYRISEPVE